MHPYINALHGIESKRYLELGIYDGANFRLVNAREKVSVDIVDVGQPTHLMTTDAYFAALAPEERFDVVFIDACHEFVQVLRDFNNSVAHLNPGGVIFCHDMAPKGIENTRPWLCNDCFKMCWLAHRVELGCYAGWKLYGGDDAGGAVFYSPPRLYVEDLPVDTSYEAFERDFRSMAVPTHAEFLHHCSRLLGD
jgi:hypothetical protein